MQRTDGLRPEERGDLRRTRQRAMRFDAVEDVCGVFLIVGLDMLVHLTQHLLHGDITIHQEADSGAGAFAEHAPQEEVIRDLATA